jgi:peptidylprolyl isomerase
MCPRRALASSALALVLATVGCGGGDEGRTRPAATARAPERATPWVTRSKPSVAIPAASARPPHRLVVRELIRGKGGTARPGDTLTVHYVGVLYRGGSQFDSSWDSGEPFSFPLGAGRVIRGWDRGLVGMRVGGRRELIIPARDGYGSRGAPPSIPPNAPLIFVVDLLAIA